MKCYEGVCGVWANVTSDPISHSPCCSKVYTRLMEYWNENLDIYQKSCVDLFQAPNKFIKVSSHKIMSEVFHATILNEKIGLMYS